MSDTLPEEERLPELADANMAAAFEDAIRSGDSTFGELDERRAKTLKLLNAAFATTIDTEKTSEQDPLPLTHIGRFELKRRLGVGGFGQVFLAHDPTLGRSVAVKIPRNGLLVDASAKERFFRERRAAASLQHPNVLPVYESGEEDGMLYIVSEFCEGPNLASWIADQNEPFHPELAAHVAMQLADAAEHSHSRGILHRDIKPANILLSLSTSTDNSLPFVPQLTDFGLAKVVDDSSMHTRTGMMLGTLKYISPEQARGDTNLTEATDIYSIGVVLYEMLTNRLPLEGETDYELLRNVCEGKIVLPDTHVTLPRDLNAICIRCLAKRPTDRYSSAGELRDDLYRFLNDQPVVANEFLQTPSRPPRKTVIAIVAASIIALLAIALSFVNRTQSSGFLEFDGVDDHVIVPTLTYDGSHPVTVELWVRPESERTSELLSIGGIINLNLHDEGGFKPSMGAHGKDDLFHLHAVDKIKPQKWSHIAGVYDGQQLMLFVNGKKQNGMLRHKHWPDPTSPDSIVSELSDNFPEVEVSPLFPESSFALGGNPWAKPEWFLGFGGCIDEVRVSRCVRFSNDFEPVREMKSDDATMLLLHFDSVNNGLIEDSTPRQQRGTFYRSWTSPQL